jgi:hypothetical protein
MSNDQSLQYVRDGISRGLSLNCRVEQELPDQIKTLLGRLSLLDDTASAAGRGEGSTRGEDATATARQELNRYLDRLGAYLPDWVCRTVKWLRKPDRLVARISVSLVLVVGGFFSFLPVLGLWMLPLGLIIISQDPTFLQRPLVAAFGWAEAQFRNLRGRFRNERGGGNPAHYRE